MVLILALHRYLISARISLLSKAGLASANMGVLRHTLLVDF